MLALVDEVSFQADITLRSRPAITAMFIEAEITKVYTCIAYPDNPWA